MRILQHDEKFTLSNQAFVKDFMHFNGVTKTRSKHGVKYSFDKKKVKAHLAHEYDKDTCLPP